MPKLQENIIVQKKFMGPPEMGNGGYVCGMLARGMEQAVEVTLRLPTPLERPLTIEQTNDSRKLLDGSSLIAEAKPASFSLDIPPAPNFATAVANRDQYLANAHLHPFPDCFVCGPNRKQGDGLLIYPAPVNNRNMLAAGWVPDASLADQTESVRTEFLWAALDCPGGILAMLNEQPPSVLGRMTAEILSPVRPDTEYVVTAWPIATDGRKQTVGTALFAADGELVARALAIWIELR